MAKPMTEERLRECVGRLRERSSTNVQPLVDEMAEEIRRCWRVIGILKKHLLERIYDNDEIMNNLLEALTESRGYMPGLDEYPRREDKP